LLEKIIIENESRYLEMGIRAKEAYLRYFDDKVFFNYLITNCLDIRKKQFFHESFLLENISPLIAKYLKFKDGKVVSIRNGINLISSNPKEILKKSTISKIKKNLGITALMQNECSE
jgi:hypothetical protein